jgi:F420-non-reducing hydrogenase iron-sulfur subunit
MTGCSSGAQSRDYSMATPAETRNTKILVLASLSGGYRGADSVGQLHADYPSNVYILPMVSAAMFSEAFYLETFEKGIDAVIVMFSGTDSQYKGDSDHTAKIINRTYPLMKERGIDTRRLRLVAICTVCTAAFLREIKLMEDVLMEIGPIANELKSPAQQPQLA